MRRLAMAGLAAMFMATDLPAQDQKSSVLVFFDWGKPELTRDAQATLDEVAAAIARARPARVDVIGHSDRSGPELPNIRASRRRAEAVRDYLVAKGVPSAAIRVAGRGEAQPIVPTEDGVREAQNRRVEVALIGGPNRVVESDATAAPVLRADGSSAGTATLSENASGVTLTVEVTGFPPGIHGLHLHAVGRCDGPDFASAGPHWNPANRKHGLANPEGPHLGDLPGLTIGPDGSGKARLAVDGATLRAGRAGLHPIFDADGSALVIHAQPDDNRTDPSGNSGERIACAAFSR